MAKNEGRTPTKVYFSTEELRLVKLAAVSRGVTTSRVRPPGETDQPPRR